MTRPDPARYPAGTRVLVEARVRDDGLLFIDAKGSGSGWPLMAERAVTVHGTVAEYEQLQAEAEFIALHAEVIAEMRVATVGERGLAPHRSVVEDVAALRTERDKLAAKAARLRQERDALGGFLSVKTGLAIQAQRDEAERDRADAERRVFETTQRCNALRAEVIATAAWLESQLGVHPDVAVQRMAGRAARQLRAALATQAPQPATMAAAPPDEAGVDDAPHQPAGGSVSYEGLRRSQIAERWRQLPAGLNVPWLAAGHKPRAAEIGEWVARQIEEGEPWINERQSS